MLGRDLWFLHQLDLFSVTPEAVQIIKEPNRFMKYMHHDITVVDQNPAAFIETFNADRQSVMFFFQAKVDRISSGLDLTVRAAGCEYDKISQ